MGWNNIKVKEGYRLFKGLPDNPYVYFYNSIVLATKKGAKKWLEYVCI